MRVVGHLENESQARTFADYLYVKGIDNQVEFQTGDGWAVWIRDEDQIPVAAQYLETFKENPSDARYREQAKSAAQLRDEEVKTDEAYRKKVRGSRELFAPLTAYGFGPLTFAMVLACALVYVLSRFAKDFDPIRSLFISEFLGGNRQLGSMLPEVRHGQVWRLFTPALIHWSFTHILFNVLCLRDLGSMIEARQGSLQLAMLTIVTAGLSNFAEYYVSGPVFGGMSGVVYGLFGYVWIRGKLDPASGLFLHPTTVIMMLAWFVLCYTPWLVPLIGHVANTVHGVGLGVGMLWGFASGTIARRY